MRKTLTAILNTKEELNNKVEEIDKKYEDGIPEEELRAIREWKKKIRRVEDEEV